MSVLAALLLPSMRHAIESSRSLSCRNNLKQISSAFMLYAGDYRNCFAGVNQAFNYAGLDKGTEKSYGMWNTLGPYTGFPQWAGFESPPTSNDDPIHIKTGSYWGKYKIKYGLGKTIWGCPNADQLQCPWGDIYAESMYLQQPQGWASKAWAHPRRLNQIQNPSGAIHVADSGDWHLGTPAGARNPSPTSNIAVYRHLEGANISFADGHAGYFKAWDVAANITDKFTLK
jgi:prepilin-type processing-associated H-X9-DG protein